MMRTRNVKALRVAWVGEICSALISILPREGQQQGVCGLSTGLHSDRVQLGPLIRDEHGQTLDLPDCPSEHEVFNPQRKRWHNYPKSPNECSADVSKIKTNTSINVISNTKWVDNWL